MVGRSPRREQYEESRLERAIARAHPTLRPRREREDDREDDREWTRNRSSCRSVSLRARARCVARDLNAPHRRIDSNVRSNVFERDLDRLGDARARVRACRALEAIDRVTFARPRGGLRRAFAPRAGECAVSGRSATTCGGG